MRLTEEDYRILKACYVLPKYADAAGVYRATSMEGAERMGRRNTGDFSGLVFPYRNPGRREIVGERERLDHPPIDLAKNKPEFRYLSPPGQRNHFYWPLADPAWLEDVTMPIVISEGEKKYLALHRAAFENLNGTGRPHYMAITFPGVWSWRGTVGAGVDKDGRRGPVKGAIPDFELVKWKGRRVVIVFDSNVQVNESVRAARAHLARELAARGAEVFFIDLPSLVGEVHINGVDDFLAACGGPELFLELFHNALRWSWRDDLAKSERGKILPLIKNAILAFQLAPEWNGVLGYDEFALRHEARIAPPFKAEPGPWRDEWDIKATAWLESHGVCISDGRVSKAIATVARDFPFHPLREYLDGLKWDGVKRLDDWLCLYCGCEPSDYTRTVGAKWMISAVARGDKPGCKVDHMLVLEGGQGIGKSRTLKILGGPYYSDDVPDLSAGKDAALSAGGVWILELSELDSMSRADVSRIKSFISRQVDRFRPPYGRHVIEAPRQCVFAGSVNHNKYLKDETGGRRFWPIECGEHFHLDSLERDRDQLWAEAVHRYRAGEPYFLDNATIAGAANEQQEARYQGDPWEPLIEAWLLSQSDSVNTQRILTEALRKDAGQWDRRDETRIGVIMSRIGGWKRKQIREKGSGKKPWFYVKEEDE